MAIPNEPYTRKEQYLNAMATGNASGIPETPYTREEMYLDAIAKGGGGGGGGGSADAALVVGSTTEGSTITLNKTYAEILEGNYCIVVFPGEDMKTIDFISDIRFDPDTPEYFVLTSAGEVFTCDSPDGYPALTMG